MQRITSIVTCREFGGLASLTSQACPLKRGCSSSTTKRPVCRQWACMHDVCTSRPRSSGERTLLKKRQSAAFAGQKYRLYSTDGDNDRGSSGTGGGNPSISVVGIPDPITWIRCIVTMHLIELYFELGITSEEFDIGVKQALVHVSNIMSMGNFEELREIVSNEMVDYVKQKCKSLTEEQRQQLAISVDDIIFLLPEDVSLLFDRHGKKFCFIVMRFWFLSTLEGPEDPEGTKIFKVTSDDDNGPQKKIVTAVYEFHREVTRGAAPDWTITNVWHWHWKLAE